MHNKFGRFTTFSLLSSITGAVFIANNALPTSLAALLFFISIGIYLLADSAATKKGKSGKTKLALDLLIVATEMIFLTAIATSSTIPKILGAGLLALISFTEVLRLGLINETRKVFKTTIGRNKRLSLLGVTLVMSLLNEIYLFYGMLTITGATFYDLTELLYRSLKA